MEAGVGRGGITATIPLDDVKDGHPPTVSQARAIDPKIGPDRALRGYRPL